MLIRPARKDDARAIAGFIAMAESEMVHHFTGTTDPEKSLDALVPFITSPTPNRYSLENNLVVEEDGKAAAAMISFAADLQPKLDILLLETLNKRGYNLDRLFFEGAPGTYYLSTMGVDPAYRGRGFGSALMKAAEERARELGFAQTSLLVSMGKPRAMGLYERVGYVPTEEVQIADVKYHRMIHTL